MDREALVDAAGAFLLPIVISVIIQDGWSDRLKTLVSLMVILLWCVFRTIYIRGTPADLEAWVTVFLISTVTCWASYQGFWKSLGVSPWLQSVTTINRP